MRVNPDSAKWNAEDQVGKPASVFTYWQNLLKTRKLYKNILVYGSFEMVDRAHESVFCYRRAYGPAAATVLLNFSKQDVEWISPPDVVSTTNATPLIHNYEDVKQAVGGRVNLRPFEALVWIEDGYKANL